MICDYTFVKNNGYKICGRMYAPDGESGRRPTVIFSHGFGSNYRELEHHGKEFQREGICCFFFDFCGGGPESLSDGTMREMTIETECEDLDVVMTAVKELDYVDCSRIFLMGESMGGLVASLVAAKRQEEIRAAVLWYPAFNVPDDVMKREKTSKITIFGLPLSWDYDEIALNLSPYEIMADFEKPVLIIHGDKDPIVPIVYSRRAAEVMKNAKLREIPGAGHGFDGEDSVFAGELSAEFLKNV